MSIKIQNATRRFGNQLALDRVDAQIAGQSMVAVLGANGAGKSTLLRSIAGWTALTRGRIEIGGHRISPNQIAIRRQIMMLDEPRPHDGSVVDGIVQIVNNYQVIRRGIEDEVADWMRRLDLIGIYGKKARGVSKGQRYKVALIGLFVVRPTFWLLDEPFSCGLDAGGLQTLEEEMLRHVTEGGTVVFTSQWPEHAVRLASDVLVLHKGRLRHQGEPKERISNDILALAEPSLAAVLRGLHGDG